MAAPEILGHLSARSGNPDVTINVSSIPDGSWMVAVLAATGSTPDDLPGDWQVIGMPVANTQWCGTRVMGYAMKFKESSDGDVTWSSPQGAKTFVIIYGSGAAPISEWDAGLIGVRNAQDVYEDQSIQAGDSTTSVAPSVEVTEADSLVLTVHLEATNAEGSFEITSGADQFLSIPEEPDFIEQLVFGEITPEVGNTPDVVATAVAPQASNGQGRQIVIPAGAAPKPGLPVNTSKGTARLTVIENGERRTPKSIRTWTPSTLDAESAVVNGTTWAHRGGSNNFPEMSEWAYDQCVFAGYGVLEFSAQRTSDGWYMGSHDITIDRASGTTGDVDISTLTKDDVLNNYQITIGTDGAPRPFYGMIDFIEKYHKTHVLMIDDKKWWEHMEWDFFDILDQYPQSRFIVKGTITGTDYAEEAARRGYVTWGYAYRDEVESGAVADSQGPWTTLGMEYNASQEVWDTMLGFNKPVAGHIAQNQSAYDTAMSKGASAVQCANVLGIDPVG